MAANAEAVRRIAAAAAAVLDPLQSRTPLLSHMNNT